MAARLISTAAVLFVLDATFALPAARRTSRRRLPPQLLGLSK